MLPLEIRTSNHSSNANVTQGTSATFASSTNLLTNNLRFHPTEYLTSNRIKQSNLVEIQPASTVVLV
ncbi:hypothetical protein PHET_01475 [Paragonimus heterotremus]|uniref:Uncharacterized protein n=1 Tax=Paragonimus heterotremus TaxID=100268 RepID=A0A8J4TRK8_9TREM|nr:hypothetical protein PHET_01475 [Paragonimus heterotremus]